VFLKCFLILAKFQPHVSYRKTCSLNFVFSLGEQTANLCVKTVSKLLIYLYSFVVNCKGAELAGGGYISRFS